MKKLNKEEADSVITLGRGNSSLVAAAIKQLQTGEGLVIEKKDWGKKTAPFRVVNYFAKKSGRVFRNGTLTDKSGWFVQRLS
jgi:hypothetical protein